MNDMAAASTADSSAWDLLIQRAKDGGSSTVTQADVFEVFELDVERFDEEIVAIRKRLGEPWLIVTVPGVGYRIDATPVGEVPELLMFAFGRNEVHADFAGDPDTVAAVKGAPRGV